MSYHVWLSEDSPRSSILIEASSKEEAAILWAKKRDQEFELSVFVFDGSSVEKITLEGVWSYVVK